jgi:thioredoxin 1
MSLLKINDNNFDSLRDSGKRVLLDFYADWCGPCRMVAPVVEEIAGERADILVGKVNVDEARELARNFQIYSIPTLVVLDGGKEIARAVGARSKAQLEALVNA